MKVGWSGFVLSGALSTKKGNNMATVKSKGLKGLIGKQVMIKGKDRDCSEGPFMFLGWDTPFLELEVEGKASWWNTDTIEAIWEAVSEV